MGGLEVGEQIEDLGLDGDVQGADGLVADDQSRLQGQRPGDRDALALSAGEGGGEAVQRVRVEADVLEEAYEFGFRGVQPVDPHRLGEDLADRHTGIEAGVRVLEDDLDLPLEPPQLRSGRPSDVDAVVADGPPGGSLQPQQHLGQAGLARAGLPHESEGPSRLDLQAHLLDGVDVPGDPAQRPGADRIAQVGGVELDERCTAVLFDVLGRVVGRHGRRHGPFAWCVGEQACRGMAFADGEQRGHHTLAAVRADRAARCEGAARRAVTEPGRPALDGGEAGAGRCVQPGVAARSAWV